MPDAPSSIETHLGYWLRLVSNSVSHSFARKLAERGVTVAEWVMLRVLHDHAQLAPSRLAEAMQMTRGAISKLADRLEAKGLVTRSADDADRRSHALALSPAARALVPVLARLADANDAEFFGSLSGKERAELARLLGAIVRRRGITGMAMD